MLLTGFFLTLLALTATLGNAWSYNATATRLQPVSCDIALHKHGAQRYALGQQYPKPQCLPWCSCMPKLDLDAGCMCTLLVGMSLARVVETVVFPFLCIVSSSLELCPLYSVAAPAFLSQHCCPSAEQRATV